MADSKQYLGDFGGTPPDGTPMRGQAGEDARADASPAAKAVKAAPENKAVSGPAETK